VVGCEYYESGQKLFSYLIQHNIYGWETVRNFVRRDFLYQHEIFFDEEIYEGEDTLFSTKCIWYAEKTGWIMHNLYVYNRREGSITKSRRTSRHVEGFLRVIEALYRVLGEDIWSPYKYSLLRLIHTMIGHCKDTLFRLDSSLEYRGWSREILTIYENFFREGVLIHDYRLFDNWDTLLSADKVYVYGAGKACKELLKKTSHRMDYSGIIVTEKCETREELYDLPIYEVGDSQIDKEALILICITGKKIQDEVKRTLCFNGFQNMLCVAREWLE
jgi:hypothetical protein